ncbi:class I SAM-dependent methyltransferase [Natrialba asiatica]|uniref:Ubiquinone/menaquinone biosynthesis methyltransferase UbiE n=1 Tax=Natrialba asiatica (strain ATCC 700177 / DSM 12278 / JCM 9576 / FERM P-10747 / NBRC 102637 / 172P1) TaxID=29540 RepID=M0AVK9_NATA1|nr:class I SAM-dependent methyltransferase [Natrialba asiatica]ELZ02575.1 ubiquinone/menaquinone biosynthesis methyltransferase UbiE [Natrialba asiatica DSM 12278]
MTDPSHVNDPTSSEGGNEDENENETTAVYDRFASAYEANHADRSVIGAQRDLFRDSLDALDGTAVLDVGCGPGWESAAFRDDGLDVVGIDLSSEFLSMASARAPAASFARMDMRSLGFAANSFDGIWSCAAVHHVPRADIRTVFAEFDRVLRPAGVALITCKKGTARETGETFGADDTRRFVRYLPDQLRALATATGFAVERLESTDEWNELLVRA